MSAPVRVLLPPHASHLASLVLDAGATPVIDATGSQPPEVPEGAWVRTRPGRPAPGSGPVVLAELGAPVPDRPTWLETSGPRDVPSGFAGLVLRGREAGGYGAEEDGLVALSRCPEPGRVLLAAGCGPATAAAAAALGAAGVLLGDEVLGCPELELSEAMSRRLELPDDEITTVVAGIRVANPPTAPVLRELARTGDLWGLADGLWPAGDLQKHLWLAGQGLALARELADRHGGLVPLLRAYQQAFGGWSEAVRAARIGEGRPAGTGAQLAGPGTAATTGGPVGSSVLWQEAAFLGRPVHGGPVRAAAATGQPVVCDPEALADEQSDLPAAPPAPAPTPAAAAPAASLPVPAPEAAPAIAVVGIGCHFPDAPGREAFWKNITSGHSAIREVPTERWDPALFHDPDADVPDKTYTKIGAFITDFEFQPKRFRIPPKVAASIDPVQQLTLHCVAEALEDAGLKVDRRSDGKEFDRERCAVILGNSLGGEVTDAYAVRLAWPEVAAKLVAVPPFCNMSDAERLDFLEKMEAAYKAGLPGINEDSMPGELANVIAGRIANAFDLGGANFTVDAACASSMAALQAAVKTLSDGDADIVLTGGADRSMNVTTYVKFCKIGALSPDHSAPFDDSANGFVMGEGCGILVLKRLEDAERDGDRIYSVIRGIGASSDGKGKGITAPNIQGQIRALTRAYAAAGIEPHQVDLIEAHGTSTVVGDKVEVEALTEVIGGGQRGDRGPVRVGSVKSMIGHLKSAAGAASCIKAALALHHGVLPPSLGFRKSRGDVPMDTVPLKVQTEAEPWPESPDGLRRAGISAFGFGGTNFHIVMESWAGQPLPRSTPRLPPVAQQAPARSAAPVASSGPKATPAGAQARTELPEGLWATSGRTREELIANLEDLAAGRPAPFHPSAPFRIAAASRDADERADQLARAIKSLKKGANPDLLRARAIQFEDAPFDGKLALLFTGQGSQYLDMGLDLAKAYPIVQQTFDEADRILTPTLGKGITEFIRLAAGEDKAAKSDLLRQTEYSQPATLTLDVAILRLLASYGVSSDMVAGHSLGEYGAAVAAGVMTFEQALLAVSARGREMANIRLDDPGKMAGIAASTQVVEEILAEVDGYVIAANKNCPSQTVIAGASDAVDEASERFKARGITVYPLPVSHAFHSAIVQPASEPLRGVLDRLGLQAPRKPITTNVTGDYYPTGDGAVPAIIDLLAQQISAPVEWVAQMERMYADGARVFVECGPKRALSGFTVAILKRRPHRALYTNHPKRGGVASFRDALAGLLAVGLPIAAKPRPLDQVDLFAPPQARRATTAALAAWSELQSPSTEAIPAIADGIRRIVARATGYEPEELDLDFELEADLGIDTVKQAELFGVVRDTYGIPADPSFRFSDHRTLRSLVDWAAERTGATRPTVATAPAPAPTKAPAPRTSGASPVVDASVVTSFLERAAKAGLEGLDAQAFAQALLPAVQGLIQAAFDASQQARPPAPAPAPAAVAYRAQPVRLPAMPFTADLAQRVVASGASVGLPGGEEVFGPDNFLAILRGDNRISHIEQRAEQFLQMGLVRLVKDPTTGQGSFLPVEGLEQVIRLAGLAGRFDLSDWGIDAGLQRALDVTTAYAFAAGLEALRDAGIPLQRTYKVSASGKQVPQGWQLPEALRDGTGVIFASAFPGYDNLIQKIANGGDDGEGRFDRRFLFQVLAMGHSQFAQLIGARGPNTSVNAACASTTQAVELADDWIRLGRCERVVIISADDVTSDALLPWIGGGFMAAGAATTHDVVEEAALPFDARRHGMILGMGAAAIVLETAAAADARGIVPLAEHLGGVVVNSAFHGTRLDVDHISGAVGRLLRDVAAKEGTTPEAMAPDTFFMSHETYTPARGGSAAAEISALRAAFGSGADQVTIANTKGFTGHAMGAGIEDATALKALQYGVVPPVANLEQPDAELGALTLSRGERHDYRYNLRLAAGFGSQLALSVWKAVARGDDRLADPARRAAWLHQVTGYDAAREVVEQRTLRVHPAEADELYDLRPDVSPAVLRADRAAAPAPAAKAPVAAPAAPAAAEEPALGDEPRPTMSFEQMLTALSEVIAVKTGYDLDELEPDFELEADLGIDTVKQAEIMSELTERFGLERDEGFRIADYPTIESLAGYLSGALAASAPAVSAATTVDPLQPAPAPVARELPDEPALSQHPLVTADGEPNAANLAESLRDLLAVVAEKTGYEPEELEPNFELEADLGIDTVKQAEIMGELTERYGLERDESFKLADHPTLEGLADYLAHRRAASSGGAVAAAPPPAAPHTLPTPESAPAAQAAPASPPPSGGSTDLVLADTLRELVDLVADRTGYDPVDLEPDFELEADLGIDTVKQAEILGELRERYGLPPVEDFVPSEHPTLEALARWVHDRRVALHDAAPAATSTPEPEPEPEPDLSEQPVITLDGMDAPLPRSATPAAPPRRDDDGPQRVELPPTFRLRRPVLVRREGAAPQRLAGRSVQVLGDGPIASALRQELGARGATSEAPFDAVVDTGHDVLDLFHRAQQLEQERPSAWVTVTRLGDMGEGDWLPEHGLVDGARAGFTKSLHREWPDTAGVVVDAHPDLAPVEVAQVVCDELSAPTDVEVFYDEEGLRHVVDYQIAPRPEGVPAVGDNPVVLITGGARGICSQVARELARRGPVQLALVGRSDVPVERLDEAAEKARIKAELKEAGERVTPAKVEEQLRPMRKAEEARQTLEDLRALGADVSYFRADVSRPEYCRRLVADVFSHFGPVDVLIHGAGVEESRLIADKNDDAFHRVYDGKALGGLALIEAVPSEAFVVSMGSVAGRFGNPGQVDYAAANDGLARVCQARPRSLHVDWTAWGDVGMAVRGGMQRLLEDRGVDLLPADAGAAVLVDLIASGVEGELVCAGRLGDFEPDAAQVHPLLDRIEREGDTVRGTRDLSKSTDPWILDHAIEGVPVLPGVIGLELMVATARELFPGADFAAARNVRFNAPVKVHHDRTTTIIVEAEPGRDGEARARLLSVRTLRTGRVSRTEHFSATLRFADTEAPESLPSAFLPDEVIGRDSIYQRFFHGPRFRVLESIFGVSADGLLAEGRVNDDGIAPGLLSCPLALEAAFQAAGLHRMLVAHEMGLPLEIEELSLLGRPQADEALSLLVQLADDGYHVDVDGTDGPILRIRGFQLVDRGPLPPGDRFPVPDEGRPVCFPSVPIRRTSSIPRSVTAEARADDDPSGWLSDDELGQLRSRGTDKRVRDRVAGRLAAKRALSSLTGVDALRIRVQSAPSGEPIATVPGHPTVRVSVSHRDGHAVAIAVDSGRIGVDLEGIEVRDPSFQNTWFHSAERDLAGDDPVRQTVLWSIKEAVLKALGTGLALSPHDVIVSSLGHDSATVTLRGEAADTHAAVGGGALTVSWAVADADEVVVSVRLAA
jgi:acyl transferase domain-containing protein/NAD(P)-dependent dehydrogenase (short-subunit alcohol dehydrogenase family)/acyl carrier protein/phosphopantetheinyl transferase